MSNIDLKLLISIARLHNTIFGNIEKSLKEYGLSISEFGVLEFLHHKGRQPVQVIANKVLVTSGTMTYIINQLIQKEYVTREKCLEDKRKIYISLTEKGKDLISEIFPKHIEFLEKQFSGLDLSAKEALTTTLFNLKTSIEQLE